MIIRKAVSADVEMMSELLSELFSIEDDFKIDTEKQSQGLRLLLEHSDSLLLVAEYEERIVAMVTLQPLISTATGGKVGLVEDFVVTESMRSQGIGKKLFAALIDESSQRGYGRLSLGADNRNTRAISFYKRFGFVASHMGLMYKVS